MGQLTLDEFFKTIRSERPLVNYVMTTESNHGHRIEPHLQQNLGITGPNQVSMADIPYIGPACLRVSGRLPGSLRQRGHGLCPSKTIEIALCLEAIQMAIRDRRSLDGIIYHSDRGVRYASHGAGDVPQTQFQEQHGAQRKP